MISVKNLTKYYGEHLAVDDISFEISEGHVYGFLGPNGAGKSTTMNIITGCLSATNGSVLIDGHDIFEEPDAAKRLIGYLPEHPPLYMNESPLEYLRFVGEAKGLKGRELAGQVNEVMEKTGISHVKNRRIQALSKGYKQRVGIAQALLGNPKVIILDEPTVGLDPIQIIEIRELITELGKTHTVIFSSHILSEVQAICDRIVMIAKGRLVAFGTPDELQKQLLAPNEIILTTDGSKESIKHILEKVTHITEVTMDNTENTNIAARALYTAHIKSDQEDIYQLSSDVFHAFLGSDHTIYEMTLKKSTLEDIFIELTEHAEENSAVQTSQSKENKKKKLKKEEEAS